MRLRFSKYEGLGNDFVVVDGEQGSALTPSDAERLCDRRHGIGADGVLVVLAASDPSAHVARMRVLNADGSTPEMCGNGLRCVALHLARERGAKTLEAIVVETDAGPRTCSVSVREGDPGEGDVLVDMGEVRSLGTKTLAIDGQTFDLHLATAGNPHAIWFCEDPLESAQRFGLAIATHASFPEGTNVGFARVHGSQIDLVVWERGVGLTLACGTGACAVGVVARSRNLVPAGPIQVRLPGGVLEIDPDPDARTRMRGPARVVYEGILA